MANAPMTCAPGECYAYQNVAFSLIGDIVFAATGQFYSEAVARRIFKPLGMNDASYGLEGIEASARWARPHVRGRGGWVSLTPKPNYYRVAPAAGVNASISDMAQWLLAQTGHRPEVLPAPLLATLHAPVVATPSEIRGASWRRSAADHRRLCARLARLQLFRPPAWSSTAARCRAIAARWRCCRSSDLGVVILWNSESALPGGLLPTILDNALGMSGGQWLDDETLDGSEDVLYAERAAPSGASASASKASPP